MFGEPVKKALCKSRTLFKNQKYKRGYEIFEIICFTNIGNTYKGFEETVVYQNVKTLRISSQPLIKFPKTMIEYNEGQ